MTILEFAVLAVAIGFIVLMTVLITAVIEFKQGLYEVRTTVIRIDSKLGPILDDLQQVTSDLKVITAATAHKIGNVETVMSALGQTGEKMQKINSMLDSVMTFSSKSSLYWTGAKSAWKYVRERLKTKGGDQV